MNNSFKGRHELSFLMQRADKELEFVQGRESWPQKTRGLPFTWPPNSEPAGLRARRVSLPSGRRRTKKKVHEPRAKEKPKQKGREHPTRRSQTQRHDGEQAAPAGRCTVPEPMPQGY